MAGQELRPGVAAMTETLTAAAERQGGRVGRGVAGGGWAVSREAGSRADGSGAKVLTAAAEQERGREADMTWAAVRTGLEHMAAEREWKRARQPVWNRGRHPYWIGAAQEQRPGQLGAAAAVGAAAPLPTA